MEGANSSTTERPRSSINGSITLSPMVEDLEPEINTSSRAVPVPDTTVEDNQMTTATTIARPTVLHHTASEKLEL